MKHIKFLVKSAISKLPFFRIIAETSSTASPITFQGLFFQKLLGFNRKVPWPVHFTSKVTGHEYIRVGFNTAPGVSISNYIFASREAPLEVGSFCAIASGVCIGTFNHDVHSIDKYTTKGPVSIGDYCWIGANAVVLSGVVLGEHTTVAAGAIVTKSFPDGHCIIGGSPAKLIKKLDKSKCVKFRPKYLFTGYIRHGKS
jgi:acetyltransferase-like isoleucine patch superfamily enzyme